MSANSTSKERAWPVSRALALAREPGKHSHPTVPGFFIRVSPQGKAVFGYRFKDKFGKEQSGTVGKVGAVSNGAEYSLEDALARYQSIRDYHESLGNTDGLTLEKAFRTWIKDHKKKGGGDLAAETVGYYTDGYERYFQEKFGSLMLAPLTTEKWMEILKTVKARSPSQARGLMWMWRSIYEHYIELEVLSRNPLSKRTIRDNFAGADTKKVRTSHVPAIDLPRFVNNIETITGKRNRIATWLLTLTGWRHSAVLRMRWEDVDMEKGVYNVREGYVGWKGYVGEVALSDYALGYLDELRKDPRYGGREWIFESRHSDSAPHMVCIRGSVKKAATGLTYKVTPHDLRRSYVTLGDMVANGNLRLVGFLVGHKKGNTGFDGNAITGGYAMRDMKLERAMANAIGEAILEIAGLLPLSDTVENMLASRGITPDMLVLQEIEDDDE